jgi:hypothetical protein
LTSDRPRCDSAQSSPARRIPDHEVLADLAAAPAGLRETRSGQEAGMSFSAITEVVPDKVYCLHNSLPLDGRLSAYPEPARGFSVSNCYVVKEPEGAYMLDTGYFAHEKTIISQLDQVIDRKTPLALFPLRINEFMSVGNALAISRVFNVKQCYSPAIDVLQWLDFESLSPDRKLPDIETKVMRGKLDLDPSGKGRRPMVGFTAPIRLINTTWIYDQTTKILFSSDMFTHIWSDKAEGPWLIEGDVGVTSTQFVRSFLLNTRYWWLEGATCEPLRKGVREVFDTYDIQTICPGYGAILKGRKAVEKQFAVLDQVLAGLDRSKVKGQYVSRDLVR